MNLIQTIWQEFQKDEVKDVGPELLAFNNALLAAPNIPTLVTQGQLLIAQAAAKQPQVGLALAADLATTINTAIEAQIAKATGSGSQTAAAVKTS